MGKMKRWLLAAWMCGISLSPAWAQDTPAQIYVAYQEVLAGQGDLQTALAFWAPSVRARLLATGDKRRLQQTLRLRALRDVRVVQQLINGGRAVVIAEGTGLGLRITEHGESNRMRATAFLVEEDGQWRIQEEKQEPLVAAPE